ncbi:MAG: VCBS repeat-containing protein [Planctomycetes bacterium]|nr:VCBS repeat-containing protein [Planctomycetota bacterium]NOG54628.1 VCBS repeat-containing protein [Planctomycetota bacterium]
MLIHRNPQALRRRSIRSFQPLGTTLPMACLAVSLLTAMTSADIEFDTPIEVSLDAGLSAIVSLRADSDSHLDLVCVNYDLGTLTVLLGIGDGTFTVSEVIHAGQGPTCVQAGDVNHDGTLDLVVGLYLDNEVAVYAGYGDGTFAAPDRYAVNDHVNGLCIHDLTADMYPEIMVAAGEFGNGNFDTLTVFANDGHGVFDTGTVYPGTGIEGFSVVSDTIDADGAADVIWSGAYNVQLLINQGDGTLGDMTRLSAGDQVKNWLICGDWDNDADVDLACSHRNDHSVTAIINNGDGTFSYNNMHTGAGPVGLAAADLDGDLDIDLVSVHPGDQGYAGLSILANNGDATYQPDQAYLMGEVPTALTASDFNEDGLQDLAVVDADTGVLTILLNVTPAPLLSSPYTFAAGGNWPLDVKMADLDNDTHADAVYPLMADGVGYVCIMFNDGMGWFNDPVMLPVGTDPASVAIGDLNNDQNLDLVVPNQTGGTYGWGDISVLYNRGGGEFLAENRIDVGVDPRAAVITDMDNDQNPDIVLASYSSNVGLIVLYGLGNGQFDDPVDYYIGNSGHVDVIAVDVDNDDDPDIVLGSGKSAALMLVANNGDRTIGDRTFLQTGGLRSIAVAGSHLDADPYVDLVASNEVSVAVFINNGDGSFAEAETYDFGSGHHPQGLAVGDFDHDDDADIAVARILSATVAILFNDGTGSFPQMSTVYTGAPQWDIDAADMDSDQDLDLIGVSYNDELVSLFYNSTIEGGHGSHYLTLSQSDLKRGVQTQFRVTDADGWETVYFLYSIKGLGTSPPVPQLGGMRLDLRMPITVLDTAIADPQGMAVVNTRVPGGVPLISIGTQAVVRRGSNGSDSTKSNVLLKPIVE